MTLVFRENFTRKKIEKLRNREKTEQERIELRRLERRSKDLESILKPISWEQYFMGMAIISGDMMRDSRLSERVRRGGDIVDCARS